MRRGIVAAALPLVLFAAIAVARADDFDRQAVDLVRGDPYKVRLSAALWLGGRPSSDGRAVSLLAQALLADKEPTVRQLAAIALGKMVGPDTPSAARARALAALDRAAAKDRNRQVKREARDSLAAVRARLPTPRDPDDGPPPGGLFVHLGPVVDPTRTLPRGGAQQLDAAVRRALVRGVTRGAVSQPGGELPTGAALDRAGQRGFYVGASLAQMVSRRRGGALEVRCRVTVRVTAWSGRDGGERLAAGQSASATGNGVVTARVHEGSRAILDCVTAVGEELTERQVVPFLRRFEGPADPRRAVRGRSRAQR